MLCRGKSRRIHCMAMVLRHGLLLPPFTIATNLWQCSTVWTSPRCLAYSFFWVRLDVGCCLFRGRILSDCKRNMGLRSPPPTTKPLPCLPSTQSIRKATFMWYVAPPPAVWCVCQWCDSLRSYHLFMPCWFVGTICVRTSVGFWGWRIRYAA